jgi:hypothetical protein
MDPEMLERLKKVEAKYEDLATWEVTSLSIEDTDTMLGVLTMAVASGEGGFKWRACCGSPCAGEDGDIPKMLSSQRAQDARETLALVESPWVVPEPSLHGSASLKSPEDILDASLRRGGSSFEAVREDISMKESVLDSSSEASGSESGSKVKSRGNPVEKIPWAPPGVGHTASQQLIQKVCEQRGIQFYCRAESISIKHQAWGQPVRQNTTILVLHSSNYGYVCVRHRETQTLYISDILHVPFLKEPGYGKVQIGIYITALEDALRRVALESAGDGASGGSPAKDSEANKCTTKKPSKKRSGTASRGGPKKRQRTIDDPEVCLYPSTHILPFELITI